MEENKKDYPALKLDIYALEKGVLCDKSPIIYGGDDEEDWGSDPFTEG